MNLNVLNSILYIKIHLNILLFNSFFGKILL